MWFIRLEMCCVGGMMWGLGFFVFLGLGGGLKVCVVCVGVLWMLKV